MSGASPSLANRAVMAIALMVGFYALALGIAGILIWIPIEEYNLIGRVTARIAFICWGLAATIVWSLIPRVDRFEPPGPRLTRATDPEVFRLIEDVAEATHQTQPEEVYLLPDFNAFVTHRGGMMGIGSRRVMGIGLPLMSSLSRDELRAVIAHEFGHYVSGDVALGPWIHKTRATIGRTLNSLEESWLYKVFEWYGRMFLRMTMGVSRAQEFVADRTAAHVAGAVPARSALRKVADLSPAFDGYIHQELVPVLQAGYLPPINDGFRRFINSTIVSEQIRKLAREHNDVPQAGLYDTHPPMSERISALGGSIESDADVDPGSAPFLTDGEQHAVRLLELRMSDEEFRKLKKIAWEDIGIVYAESWQQTAQAKAEWYGSLTVDTLPAGKDGFADVGKTLYDKDRITNSDERIGAAAYVLHCGVAAALVRSGWRVATSPGHPLEIVRDGHTVNPSAVIATLIDHPESSGDWKARCQEMGIAGLRLSPQP